MKIYSFFILLLFAGCKTKTSIASGQLDKFPYGAIRIGITQKNSFSVLNF